MNFLKKDKFIESVLEPLQIRAATLKYEIKWHNVVHLSKGKRSPTSLFKKKTFSPPNSLNVSDS